MNTALTKRKLDYSSFPVLLMAMALLRGALDLAYLGFINPVYEEHFLSFKYNYNPTQYFLSWLCYLLCSVTLRGRLIEFVDFFLLFTVIILIAPITSVWGMDVQRPIEPLAATLFAFFILLIFSRSRIIKAPYFPTIKNSRIFLLIISWILVAFLITWFIYSGGASTLNFDPNKVYLFREANSKIVDVGFLAYLNLWVQKFFIIFLIVYSLYKRQFLVLVLLLIIQVFFYGVTTHKIILFLPLMSIGVWYYFRRTDNLATLPMVIFIVIVLAYTIYKYYGIEMPAAMLIRRTFYVPAGMTFEWFSFFSENPMVYWSDEALSLLFEYPYDRPIPYVVGITLENEDLAANNGLVSAGYAHAGWFGIFIYALVLGYIVRIINVFCRKGIPLWMALALTIGPIKTALTDSDLLTSITSHGLLFSVIIIILFRNRGASD